MRVVGLRGAMIQRPFADVPSSAAKQASESNRGHDSQSIEPLRPTSAALSQSPMMAYSSMRLGMISKDKIDDRPDVAPSTLERFAKARERDAARDPALKPGPVGSCQSLRRRLVVAPVGVHGAEHNIAGRTGRAGAGSGRRTISTR